MAIINQPDLLPGEFASDGDKNIIPANNDGLSGLASIAKGFPPITQQPLASGGLPPQRADFNGIFNLISQFLLYSQNGGVFTYSATLDYNPPAMVGDNKGNIYICIAQNGPNTTAGVQATSNASYWVKVINANVLTTILEDYALSSALNDYVLLSGGNMTGILNLFAGSTVTTPSASDNSTKIANTEWVQDYIDNFLVGNVIYRPFLQEGYVKLNGATVQREDYPRLVQYATDNSLFTADNSTTPWLFGNGDGETTFVLPDYRNVFIEGGDTPSKIEAGLPNITGETTYIFCNIKQNTNEGALTLNGTGEYFFQSTSSDIHALATLSMDASKSNSIYGNAETVQPPSIVLIPQIKC